MGSVQKETTTEPAVVDDKLSQTEPEQQAPDTPGQDENGDGLPGGQSTADTVGDVLGI